MKGIDLCCSTFLTFSFIYAFLHILLFRLFIGSPLWCTATRLFLYPLHINSIRLTRTSLNLERVISAITATEALFFYPFICDPPSTYKHGEALSSLFKYILGDRSDRKFNTYVYKTFELFRANKRSISINLPELDSPKHFETTCYWVYLAIIDIYIDID